MTLPLIKVGTDFSGIGSPEQAIKNLNIKHDVIFACDIDKYARKSYLANHDCNTMYEDITKRDHSEVPKLDLYIAGFPCQAFSIAGQRKGFEDVRGTLFFNVADFIRINQPEVFILENVKGLLSHDSGRTFQTIIDLLSNCGGTVNDQMLLDIFEDGLGYHIYYQVLNTKEHGIPQNRERVFIVGFRNYREYRFPLKEPLKLKLKDILEDEVDEKYFLSDKMIQTLIRHSNSIIEKETPESSGCVHACYFKMGGRDQQYIKVNSATKKGYEEAKEGDSINFSVPGSKTRRGRVGKEVAQTLDTSCNQAVLIGAMRGRNPQNPKSRKSGLETEQMLEINESGTSNCLTSVQKDNLVVMFGTEKNNQGARIYDSDGIASTQNAGGGGLGGKTGLYHVESKIRRLTPLECWRLQGFSDEQFYKAAEVNSDTQLYKQAGNSITVNVIQKVISNIYFN